MLKIFNRQRLWVPIMFKSICFKRFFVSDYY
nr:MAG TPA: hypothetical protein [Caudoviricetes sp.]